MRVFYQLRAGLPRPQVYVPLFDRTGRLLGIADLFDEDAAFVCEFDGQDHRQRRQHWADNVREEGLEATGLTVVRADSLDLRHYPEELERRLRSGWQLGMARNRGYDQWTTREPDWWLAQSNPLDELTGAELAEFLG